MTDHQESHLNKDGLLQPRLQVVLEGLKLDVLTTVRRQLVVSDEYLEHAVEQAMANFDLNTHIQQIVHSEMRRVLESKIRNWDGAVKKQMQAYINGELLKTALFDNNPIEDADGE